MGWEEEVKGRCHFEVGEVGREGESMGEEKEVEEVGVVRLEVSSAPEDVTSWEVFRGVVSGLRMGRSRESSEPEGLRMTVLILRDFL